MAHRLAELTGTDVTFEDADGRARPARGRRLAGRLHAWPSTPCRPPAHADLWGRPYERARTHLLALRVDDRVAAERALAELGVRVLRSDAMVTVVDPGRHRAACRSP